MGLKSFHCLQGGCRVNISLIYEGRSHPVGQQLYMISYMKHIVRVHDCSGVTDHKGITPLCNRRTNLLFSHSVSDVQCLVGESRSDVPSLSPRPSRRFSRLSDTADGSLSEWGCWATNTEKKNTSEIITHMKNIKSIFIVVPYKKARYASPI